MSKLTLFCSGRSVKQLSANLPSALVVNMTNKASRSLSNDTRAVPLSVGSMERTLMVTEASKPFISFGIAVR